MSDDVEHTPAPWELVDKTWDIEVKKGDYIIASVHSGVPNGALEENARLIAAAPKMKSRLRNLIHEASDAADILEGRGMTGAASDLRRCIRNSEHAIAEAEGRHE